MKKIISPILMVLIIFSFCFSFTSCTISSSNFKYKTLSDGTIEITEFFFPGYEENNNKERLFSIIQAKIPNEIEGKPVTSIGPSVFYGCESIKAITIPDTVTSIGKEAFSGCSSLKEIDVSESNTKFASVDGVLYNKEKTKIIYFPVGKTTYSMPDSVTSIGKQAFKNCSKLKSLKLGKKVKTIGDYAFFDCSKLKSIKLSKKVKIIGDYAFYGCTSLTSITIPDSVKTISNYAFSGCTSLTSVTIGNSVTNIGKYAFQKCASLTSTTIPDNVTSIGDSVLFYDSSSLTSINVSENNNSYTSINGVLFNKDKTEIICYPAGKTDKSYIIPNSVTGIGDSAFEGCTSLTSVTLPDGLKTIGDYAFSGCKLMTVTIPDSVTTIGDRVFGDSIIFGKRGSAAEKYAEENKIHFEEV